MIVRWVSKSAVLVAVAVVAVACSDGGGAGSGVGSTSAGDAVALEVVVWDDTESRLPASGQGDDHVEVWVVGHGSWFPDLGQGPDSENLGNFAIGEENEFFIYPDGRNGTEIRVPFKMHEEMTSGSVRDQASVVISDDAVTVTFTALEGTEKVYDR